MSCLAFWQVVFLILEHLHPYGYPTTDIYADSQKKQPKEEILALYMP